MICRRSFTGSLWVRGPSSYLPNGFWAILGAMRTQPGPHALVPRSEADIALDLEVALRIEGYRWMEWSRSGLREAPLYREGRFVGHPGDMAAQHYVDARPSARLAEHPYERLPQYSSDPGLAIRAAERAGLFLGDGARLSSTSSGSWRLRAASRSIDLTDDSLPRLLCRASLRWIEGAAPEGLS